MSERVKLATLSIRTDPFGIGIAEGWLGRSRLIATLGARDRHGCPTMDVYLEGNNAERCVAGLRRALDAEPEDGLALANGRRHGVRA